MLIVVMMGRWSDDYVCLIVHDVRLYSVLDTVVISGEDVCCSVNMVQVLWRAMDECVAWDERSW